MNREDLAEIDEDIVVFDGLEEALIGHCFNWGNQKHVAVYDYNKIISIFIHRDGMDIEEAIEYTDFNVLGLYAGEHTPIVVINNI